MDVGGARSEVTAAEVCTRLVQTLSPDPIAAELEAALHLRRRSADARELRRALRRIEELLDDA